MAQFPAANYLSNAARTEGEMKTALEDVVAATKQIPGAAVIESELTIATGSVTATAGVHAIDTEADAATDDLTNIVQTNLPDGSLLLIRNVASGRVVVVKHSAGGAGQITLFNAADFTLDDPKKWMMLKRTGTLWEEVAHWAAQIPSVTTRGDLIAATAANVLARLALGPKGRVLLSDGTDPVYSPVPAFNYTFNGDMEVWGAGTSAAPTGWTLTGAGASVAKNTTGGQFKLGTASAAVTRAGADGYISQSPDTFAGFGPVGWWQGKTVTFGCWVRATVASRARLSINDGVGTTDSAYHTGGSALEFLTVTRVIDAAATKVELRCGVDTGDTTAQFDGAILVVGAAVSDFIPSGWRGRKAIIERIATAHAQADTIYLRWDAGSSTEANVSQRAPFKFVARNLHLDASANIGGSGQTWIVTLRTGEATDTALTATVSSGARTASDLTNQTVVTKGTYYSLKSVTSATTGTIGAAKVAFEIEEVP